MKYLVAFVSIVYIGGCASTVQQSYLDGSNAYLAGDYELAKKKVQKCALANYRQCNYILGRIAYKQDSAKEAIPFFLKDAETGHKESQAFLALSIYKVYLEHKLKRQTPPKELDLSDAISWIWIAKKQGYNDSANLFAKLTFELAEERKVDPGVVAGLMLEKLKKFEDRYLTH